ncbi:hypothetical protein [Paenibacillus sp. NPDC058071]|uniref:hypothetical protein n=1 Tax=Paenibacillus sp. NPDC058071 TaxID=3346326 RepID=UPI0036D7EDA6
MKDEEKVIFELFDQLDIESADLELMQSKQDIPKTVTEDDAAAITRIKALTFSKLQSGENVTSPSPLVRSSQRRRYIAVVAAVIAVLFIAVQIVSTPSVQAELRKVLRFFPGFGTVQEGNASQPTYVLEKPYVQKMGAGTLTVDGIVLQQDVATITLQGIQTPEVKEFEAEVNGRLYAFTSSMRSSSGDWLGYYVPIKGTNVPVPVADTITLHINDSIIGPIKLVPPKTAGDLEHLGSSAVQQDIMITAFPTKLEEGIVRIQLVSKLPLPSLSVSSYGVSPLVKDTGLYVEDAEGTKASLLQADTLTYSSGFRFRETLNNSELLPYTVVIPYIEVHDREAISEKVSIPLPEVGSERTIDITAEVRGFPVKFTSIKRTSETTVNVEVDLAFDSSKNEALLYFLIRYPDSNFNNSFSWENVDKNTAVMKTLYLETKPGQTSLQFSLTKPHFLIKGPWTLPLKFE